jgi:hypothetical protein
MHKPRWLVIAVVTLLAYGCQYRLSWRPSASTSVL